MRALLHEKATVDYGDGERRTLPRLRNPHQHAIPSYDLHIQCRLLLGQVQEDVPTRC